MSTTSNFTYTRTPTLADPHGQDEYSSAVSIRRLKFLLRNHRRAIEMFETIRPWQHEQSVWIRPEKNACGTVACAAGWVALTNTIPGFQYTREPSEYAFANDNFYPVVNGRRSDWNTANYSFFGKHTTENIFGIQI